MRTTQFAKTIAFCLGIPVLAAGLTLFATQSLAQGKKKPVIEEKKPAKTEDNNKTAKASPSRGVKIVNNEAVLEKGFEFKIINEDKAIVVKSGGATTRSKKEEVASGTATISCFCVTEGGSSTSCGLNVSLFGGRATCKRAFACGQARRCLMSVTPQP